MKQQQSGVGRVQVGRLDDVLEDADMWVDEVQTHKLEGRRQVDELLVGPQVYFQLQ